MNQRFNQWNELKQTLQNKTKMMYIKQGEIYFMSIGQNIGFETYGKDKLFLRPVLVYKKLSKYSFIGIPLTSKKKEGSYFFNFQYKENKESTALLSQIRSFDTKRVAYYSGNIKNEDFTKLKEKLISLLDITPKRGGITSEEQKQRNKTSIISNIKGSVNLSENSASIIESRLGELTHGFKVTPSKEKRDVGVKNIYEFVQKHQPVRTTTIAKNFTSVTQRTIERWIKQLKDEKKIEFRGSPRTGGYFVIKSNGL